MLQNFYNFSLSSVTFPFFFYNLYLNEIFIKCTTGIFFRNIDIRFLIFYLNKTKPFGITDKCSCQIRFFSFIFSPLFFFLSLFSYSIFFTRFLCIFSLFFSYSFITPPFINRNFFISFGKIFKPLFFHILW